MVLYFVGTPEAASLVERVGFTGEKLIRVEEHSPQMDGGQFWTVSVAVPDDIDLYEHGVVSAQNGQGREWLLSPGFLNRFQRARLPESRSGSPGQPGKTSLP